MAGSGDVDFESILRARKNLAELRAGGEAPPAPTTNAPDAAPALPVQGIGSAADERVRAVVTAGRVSSLELVDSRLLRLDPAELAVHLSTAVNAALDDARAKIPSGEMPDLTAIAERLHEVRTEGMRQMARISSSLREAMAQIRQGANAPADGVPPDLDELFAETDRTLASVTADAGEPLDGHGESADGLVTARCTLPGRVTALEAGARTVRAGSVALTDGVRTAVNAALDDLERRRRERGRAVATDPDALERRVRAVQDRGIELMRAHSRAADDWANGIQPRD